MKILFTVSTYYPKNDGVSRVTKYLAEGLVGKGHDVTVITSSKGSVLCDEIYNGVKIKRVNLYTKYGLYFGDKRYYKKLISAEANKCDVMINVCTQNAFTDLILNSISKYNCKKILYLHGMFNFGINSLDFSNFVSIINKIWKEIRWFLYYRTNGRYFKKYNVVTQLHNKDYANLYFKKKYNIDSVIIENAADDEFFASKNILSFKKPFERYIIYVANYEDGKNQKLAITEFLKSNINPKIGLVLIGSCKNQYYKKLKKHIIKMRKILNIVKGNKPILMLHNIKRSDIHSFVSNAEIYLMTSKREVYPISIVEAMACGVPYICTNVGVVKYFCGGIVCKENDISYWLEYFLKNNKIRNEYSKISKTFAMSNFTIEEKIKLLEKIM